MIFFQCKVCRTSLSAQETQRGQQVRCPNCMAAVTVPAMSREAVAVASAAPAAVPATPKPPPVNRPTPKPATRAPTPYGRRYGFNCVYCSSRLEATETMAAQEGQCPTCGNAITIPILNRYGQLIDPVTKEIIKQDPHPVHAYAAAGERAPAILRDEDGKQIIVCSKCRRPSPITSNNCKHCGMPFTMEGTTPDAAGNSNGFAVASLVLGIIGVPAGCTMIVPLLAVVFGTIALIQGGKQPTDLPTGRGQAIAGVICGVVGLGVGVLYFLR